MTLTSAATPVSDAAIMTPPSAVATVTPMLGAATTATASAAATETTMSVAPTATSASAATTATEVPLPTATEDTGRHVLPTAMMNVAFGGPAAGSVLSAPVLTAVFIKMGDDSEYTEPDFPLDGFLSTKRTSLLLALNASWLFREDLKGVKLTSVKFRLLNRVMGILPTVEEELAFVELVVDSTIKSTILPDFHGRLFIHVIMPANAPAAQPVVASVTGLISVLQILILSVIFHVCSTDRRATFFGYPGGAG
jgi:hypothetical protein